LNLSRYGTEAILRKAKQEETDAQQTDRKNTTGDDETTMAGWEEKDERSDELL